MATTTSDLIERVRVLAGDRPVLDKLNAGYALAATALTLLEGKVSIGQRLSIELETMICESKDSAVDANVRIAQEGTTNATHASGTLVRVAPRYTDHQYLKAINEALGAISVAFGVATWDETQTFGATKWAIEVPSGAIRVFMLAEKPSGITGLKAVPHRFRRSVPTSIWSSGKAVELTSFYNPGSGTAYIGYEKAWPALALLTDNLSALYPTEALDLIELGAMSYLEDAEAFRRVAYTAPHAREAASAAQIAEVEAASRENLTRFLIRRGEVAPLYQEQNFSAFRGI